MRSVLADQLAAWDQKDTVVLKKIYAEHHDNPLFLDELIDCCANPDQQTAATWLIKHTMEQTSDGLSAALEMKLIGALPRLHDWAAMLHALQILDKLGLPDTSKQCLTEFVARAGQSEKTLVRAWAYYGLAVSARRFPELREEATETLNRLSAGETAGSIKVRIRKALEYLDR